MAAFDLVYSHPPDGSIVPVFGYFRLVCNSPHIPWSVQEWTVHRLLPATVTMWMDEEHLYMARDGEPPLV